jgi:hypothetical protein
MSESAPAKKPGFFLALTLGPDGLPDEFAVGFIVAQIVINLGFIFNAIMTHSFATGDYALSQSGLLSSYGAILTGRSRWGQK